mmetsp:Transcript_64018/g.139202  ORF Transcript_64018/g.139202 Transcript_64018/m.139202 type:complete len:177 (-) Transcript_64018:160-690(-)|eukprot:CAMPEP_0170595188 /NCGR_PEP_ID=MMETSP0224-20130122/14419_1 /TAXON_ID=285029 /ORGANISM="Togula jolla, Strain CCCM 725" /LENGTH=176 /DNA_ID=CAMNT_0010919333 /DNA_START=70 /DNA_END=600 /DNA_ORIENTATION=-
MALLGLSPWQWLGILLLIAAIAYFASQGTGLKAVRQKLVDLKISPEVMATSLAFGFSFGTLPLYIPVVPTIVLGALASLLKLSMPAAIVGLNLATPFFLIFFVPFVRAGEWLSGQEAVVIDTLKKAMEENIIGALQTFSSRLLLAALAWACASPILFGIAYFLFRPLCHAMHGKTN